MPNLPNLAGKNCDDNIRAELEKAGIEKITELPENMRGKTGTKEVFTIIVGEHKEWTFERGWAYWIAEGPTMPIEQSTGINNEFGQEVRHIRGEAEQDAGICRYYINTTEGLEALRKTLDKMAFR